MLPATRFVELPPFAVEGERSVTFPNGFVAAGVATGVKKRGKLDLGILRSLRPAVSAATFTRRVAREFWESSGWISAHTGRAKRLP